MPIKVVSLTVALSGELLEQILYFIEETKASNNSKMTVDEVVETSIQHFLISYKHRKERTEENG
jgi:hypothetical protein